MRFRLPSFSPARVSTPSSISALRFGIKFRLIHPALSYGALTVWREPFDSDRFIAEAQSYMNILAAIRREERKLERQVGRLQKQLDGLRTAANALGGSAIDGAGRMQKRVMSAAARAKISKAAKRRWARVKAGAKKAAS